MMRSLWEIEVGDRVWTKHGLHDHGPAEGPSVCVPENTLGTVVSRTVRFGNTLWMVKWDTKQESGHYTDDLHHKSSSRNICIGKCQTIDEYYGCIGDAKDATVFVGPAGGFRRAEVNYESRPMAKIFVHSAWKELFEPILQKRGVTVTELPA